MVNEVMDFITGYDKEVGEAIQAECARQRRNLELIASENIVSEPVMMAMGTVLTNKYAEGYSGKRYYGGCQCVDVVETLAIERAKKLFGCDYANVQPHSGAQANMAVFVAMLKARGHGHGHEPGPWRPSDPRKPCEFFRPLLSISYLTESMTRGSLTTMSWSGLQRKPGQSLSSQGPAPMPGPLISSGFVKSPTKVGAYLMVDMAHIAGLVAAGEHPSPIPYADVVTTTTHKTLRGPRGGMILANKEAAEKFNFNKAIFPGTQGGPLEHVIAGKAVCFGEALKPEFKAYQHQVAANAKALAQALKNEGFKLLTGRHGQPSDAG